MDAIPNYLNLHNIDPARVEPARSGGSVKPDMDLWALCPSCGAQPDFDDCGGMTDRPDGSRIWIGPSYCPSCGQQLDLSEPNGPAAKGAVRREYPQKPTSGLIEEDA